VRGLIGVSSKKQAKRQQAGNSLYVYYFIYIGHRIVKVTRIPGWLAKRKAEPEGENPQLLENLVVDAAQGLTDEEPADEELIDAVLLHFAHAPAQQGPKTICLGTFVQSAARRMTVGPVARHSLGRRV
jgi:hypothetical protein